jgi:hypothetical protein
VRGQKQRGNEQSRGLAHMVSDLVEQISNGLADGLQQERNPESA